LHFFLEGPEGLIDVVVADEDLHGRISPQSTRGVTATPSWPKTSISVGG
jgi:hypothetical protein